MFVKRSVKLWWLASGIMAILFAASALMDYLRHFYNQAAAGSAPYWAYLVVRAIEFLIPSAIFALVALGLFWKHRQKHDQKKEAD